MQAFTLTAIKNIILEDEILETKEEGNIPLNDSVNIESIHDSSEIQLQYLNLEYSVLQNTYDEISAIKSSIKKYGCTQSLMYFLDHDKSFSKLLLKNKNVASLESLRNTVMNRDYIVIAIEGILNDAWAKIKEWWEKFKKFCINVYNKIKNIFLNLRTKFDKAILIIKSNMNKNMSFDQKDLQIIANMVEKLEDKEKHNKMMKIIDLRNKQNKIFDELEIYELIAKAIVSELSEHEFNRLDTFKKIHSELQNDIDNLARDILHTKASESSLSINSEDRIKHFNNLINASSIIDKQLTAVETLKTKYDIQKIIQKCEQLLSKQPDNADTRTIRKCLFVIQQVNTDVIKNDMFDKKTIGNDIENIKHIAYMMKPA